MSKAKKGLICKTCNVLLRKCLVCSTEFKEDENLLCLQEDKIDQHICQACLEMIVENIYYERNNSGLKEFEKYKIISK
jgi:hypothetical protein